MAEIAAPSYLLRVTLLRLPRTVLLLLTFLLMIQLAMVLQGLWVVMLEARE